MNQVAADANHVTLAATYRESPATFALADPKRLRQVMINLLSNAIKYNRSGGRAEVHTSTDGEHTHVEVIDTGIGMDASQLARLYEPFNRLGRERNGIEGTGLGLALAKQLVQLMEGEMHVVSAPDEGTKVRVTLRACDAFDAKLQAPRKPRAAATTTDDSSPIGVVLYIEDNPVNLLLVEQLLMRWPNVTLLQAETGVTGISIARSAKPDLVLLDMRLPDMDGIEVLGALFDGDSGVGCRVVALSASAMPEEVAAARSAGACGY
jgi:CheY-like chemotaxis protein/anti-sigma regulatory factor (Ser/Thr protein kinase)